MGYSRRSLTIVGLSVLLLSAIVSVSKTPLSQLIVSQDFEDSSIAATTKWIDEPFLRVENNAEVESSAAQGDSGIEIEQDKSPPASSSSLQSTACLILKDDNDILPEWIAYHYTMLPLRYLVVMPDPKSRQSPKEILTQWDGTDLNYWIWKPINSRLRSLQRSVCCQVSTCFT